MKELSFAQSFSLLTLNTQDSKRMTTEKKIALRGIAAATLLELYLDDRFQQQGADLTITKDLLDCSFLTLYHTTVLKALLGSNKTLSYPLSKWLKLSSKISTKALQELEHNMADLLICENLLEEIPSLFGCDLEIVTAGLSIFEYRSQADAYTQQIEALRIDVLEYAHMTDKTLLTLWLLKETGSLSTIFSVAQLEKISACMSDLYDSSLFAKEILSTSIHHTLETAIKGYLDFKTRLINTPTGTGINFILPVLERSASVFIETESWFANADQRLQDLEVRLTSQGHLFTIYRTGSVPLLKIDNILYEAVPEAMVYDRVPIHGVRLRRYPLY